MLTIDTNDRGEVVLQGKFDASQVEKARKVFDTVTTTTVVNFQDLEYISSAGLGVLLLTQKRLLGKRERLILSGMNSHIKEIFKYAGFDNIFEIKGVEKK